MDCRVVSAFTHVFQRAMPGNNGTAVGATDAYQTASRSFTAPSRSTETSCDTRFVIITHNPITMARMNRLYGVTMAERGVSQLVSVDLDGAVQLREAV